MIDFSVINSHTKQPFSQNDRLHGMQPSMKAAICRVLPANRLLTVYHKYSEKASLPYKNRILQTEKIKVFFKRFLAIFFIYRPDITACRSLIRIQKYGII